MIGRVPRQCDRKDRLAVVGALGRIDKTDTPERCSEPKRPSVVEIVVAAHTSVRADSDRKRSVTPASFRYRIETDAHHKIGVPS